MVPHWIHWEAHSVPRPLPAFQFFMQNNKLFSFLANVLMKLFPMLMKLLSNLSEIRLLICGNIRSCLLNLNLTYEALWTGAQSGLLISLLKKSQLVSSNWSNKCSAIDMKINGYVLAKKWCFKALGLPFSS